MNHFLSGEEPGQLVDKLCDTQQMRTGVRTWPFLIPVAGLVVAYVLLPSYVELPLSLEPALEPSLPLSSCDLLEDFLAFLPSYGELSYPCAQLSFVFPVVSVVAHTFFVVYAITLNLHLYLPWDVGSAGV